MKVFYHCYGSSHTSVVAASLHVGLLPRHRCPTYKEIVQLPHFDKVTKDQVGRPFLIGEDRWGNQVYTIGLENNKQVMLRAAASLMKAFDIPAKEAYWVDALRTINLPTRLGGFLSRRLGLVFAGRPLAVAGIIKAYKNFIQIVEEVEWEIAAAQRNRTFS